MQPDYLHNHPEFKSLINIVAREKGISPAFVEKDYWIMHCLYGIQHLNLSFEVKGGTSLSKAYGLTERMSQDIDIRFEPLKDMVVKTGRNHNKPPHLESRKNFYDRLANILATNGIDGIVDIKRDYSYDDKQYRSGGIKLCYNSNVEQRQIQNILLEVGFDNVDPNNPVDITSWAYEYAVKIAEVNVIDNRAKKVDCYHPGYTFVEKLQAITKKYRQHKENGSPPIQDFVRHYYDVYCLLQSKTVQDFIRTDKYTAHKVERFKGADKNYIVISENEAFLLSKGENIYDAYEKAYQNTSQLYYGNQPPFETIMATIKCWVDRL